jgi:PAS domain S-box-containing protein
VTDDATVSGPWTRALLDAMPDAMLVVDLAGRIVLVNQHTERLFGYPAPELVGTAIEILVPEATRALHQTLRRSYTEAPQHRPMGTSRPSPRAAVTGRSSRRT